MPDAASRATDFSWKMVGLSTAYATLWGVDRGLEKISFDLIGVKPIMNWVAEDLKEAIMTAAVEQAVLHGIDYSENHLAAFLSRFKVPEHVTRSAMGAAHGFVEDVGVDTASQAAVAAMAGLKAGVWGAAKGAGQGVIGGFVAGGPLGAVGGAVVGALAQGVWEGGQEALLVGASSPDALAALNVSGTEWLLGEFATYMDVHREGAWRQLDDVIDRPLKSRGISSEKFWGGDLVRRFMKGTIKFLIKHTIVESYKKTDYESRRRAMQYRLAIYAFSKCSSLGGAVTDLWGNAIDKAGELSSLFKRTKDNGIDWKTTLEYKYSFIGDDTQIEELKALLEGLEEDEDKLRAQLAEREGRIQGNRANKKALETSILEKYGENGSKIEESEKNKRKAYEKSLSELSALNNKILEDQSEIEALSRNLETVNATQETKAKELEKAVEAYCGVSTKDVKEARRVVSEHKLMIMEADHMIGVFQEYIHEQSALLKELETAESALKEAQRALDQANKEVAKNKKDNRAKETVARSVRQAAEKKARVDHLLNHIRNDFNIEAKSEKGGAQNVRKVIADLKNEIKTLENEKKVAKSALPKVEKQLAEEEAKFRQAMAGALAKQMAQCTLLADDCVNESKKIIRLGMLVRDGYITHEEYEESISLIRLKLSELPDRDPRKLAFEKVVLDFSYENLFPVGHRNTSIEIESDGKLTVQVFNTDMHSLDAETEAETELAFKTNLVARFELEAQDTLPVEGHDVDEHNNPVTTSVSTSFVNQVDSGGTFTLELSMRDDNPRISGRLDRLVGFLPNGDPMYEGMSESQKAIEKLRVMTGGDELMMAKAAQIINLETAQAILDPLKQAVIEGRNETGFNTKMILKDEDNPEYIFQVGEIPGSGLVITVTARWEIEGHETGDRKHTVNGKAPSTVEAKTQFVIHQGDLIKVATGREIEVPVEGGEKRGFFSKLIFGSAAETKKIPELIDERQAPTCEFKSCVITRTLYDDLVVEDLGLGEKHPKAPEMAVNQAAPLVDDIQDDLQEEAAIGNEAPRAQNRVIDEQERAAEIAEEIQIEQQPIVPEKDIREDAIDSLKEMLQGTLGTIVTDKEKLTEIEAYNYLFDINNAFISDFKDLDITYSIGDEDDRLKGGEIENKNGLNEVIAPVIEKLYTMAGEDTKVMKVATQCLNNEAARALFDGNVKTAIANGRELEGSPDYSFEVIETNGGLKIRTTAVWSISGSDEKAQGTLEFMIREGTMKQVVVQKEIRSGGGWFSNPKIEVISVFEEQKQPPTLEFISLTVA